MTYVPDYVVFDCETTGVSVKTDQIIELSAIKVEQGSCVGEYSSLVNPGMSIPYGATQVNHISDEMVAGAPSIEKVLEEFMDFAGDSILVGHNIHTFDMPLIWRESERVYGFSMGNDYVDTLALARYLVPGLPKYRLTDLAVYYACDCENAHRALGDCRMNQVIFECLGKEKVPENAMLCPRCSSPLVRRKGKFGEFWGCSSYPNCRFTRNIS